MQPQRARMIAEIEARLGEPIERVLRRMYLAEQKGFREIGAALGMNPQRTVPRLLRLFGIPVRHGSDAVAAQWADDPDRRRKQSLAMRGRVMDVYRRRPYRKDGPPAPNGHWATGLTKETDDRIARKSRRLRRTTSARRPEVRHKLALAKIHQHRTEPMTHPNARRKMTSAEHVFCTYVRSHRVEVLWDYLIQPFWISFFFPKYGVGVQLFKSSRPPSWWRHEYIERQGIRMLYFPTRWATGDYRPGRSPVPRVEKIGELLDAIQGRGREPASLREKFVIGRYIKLPPSAHPHAH